MRIALDTNRYADLAQGVFSVVEIVERASEIYLPLIVLAELRSGFLLGSKRERNESILTQFLNSEGISILIPDEQTTFFYAEVFTKLRKKGTPISTNDIWIASLCLQHSLILFDRDKDFDFVPQLARIGAL